MLSVGELYDLSHTAAADYLKRFVYPWEALKGIRDMITWLGKSLKEDYAQVSEGVWIHRTASIATTAFL